MSTCTTHWKAVVGELRLWIKLRHKNILPCLGFIIVDDLPGFVSELMKNGNLREYISKHPYTDRNYIVCFAFDSSTVIFLLYQVSETTLGLEYLHSKEIIHSDLKSVRQPSSGPMHTHQVKIGEYTCQFWGTPDTQRLWNFARNDGEWFNFRGDFPQRELAVDGTWASSWYPGSTAPYQGNRHLGVGNGDLRK